MCEETQAYSCRETELGRPSYREAPLGRGWRAGKAATPEGCARRDLPPQAPPGARVPFRRNRTANRGRKDLREFWHLGFPEEKANSPWPLHSTTQPLSGAAEANRALDPPLTDGLKAQSEGASDRADLPRHQRNKSKLREKEPGDRDRKTTCTSHNITHSETREHGWNPWSKSKVLFKDKDK